MFIQIWPSYIVVWMIRKQVFCTHQGKFERPPKKKSQKDFCSSKEMPKEKEGLNPWKIKKIIKRNVIKSNQMRGSGEPKPTLVNSTFTSLSEISQRLQLISPWEMLNLNVETLIQFSLLNISNVQKQLKKIRFIAFTMIPLYCRCGSPKL